MSKLTGKVLWFDERDGNGIIKGDDGYKYYTDISVTPNRKSLKHDQTVTFEANPNIPSCLCAWKVELT